MELSVFSSQNEKPFTFTVVDPTLQEKTVTEIVAGTQTATLFLKSGEHRNLTITLVSTRKEEQPDAPRKAPKSPKGKFLLHSPFDSAINVGTITWSARPHLAIEV